MTHPFSTMPVPPALVYLLHQLRLHQIKYRLYGEVADTGMVFVDLDHEVADQLDTDRMPASWSLICPHFLSQRALVDGQADPISDRNRIPEAIVIAFGGREAERLEHFQALCEQVRYLRQLSPSRLVYHNDHPPEPVEIHEIISHLKLASQARD
ncbi:hypothetical protein [Reinekea sp.]|uniref:hypothetical protein n=1 Tax=Reinekea sp. TaxID=1970455 RepID=UPI002A81196F|nr:hypothetical protein [Reinekea sp.]